MASDDGQEARSLKDLSRCWKRRWDFRRAFFCGLAVGTFLSSRFLQRGSTDLGSDACPQFHRNSRSETYLTIMNTRRGTRDSVASVGNGGVPATPPSPAHDGRGGSRGPPSLVEWRMAAHSSSGEKANLFYTRSWSASRTSMRITNFIMVPTILQK